MSTAKYPSIFSLQMEAIVFIILQIFYAMHAVLKIGEYSRIFSGNIQSHAMFRPTARKRKYLMIIKKSVSLPWGRVKVKYHK